MRVRMREGTRGRSLGRPSNAPPCGCGGDLQEAIVLSSLVFNKWAPLHVHNQQLSLWMSMGTIGPCGPWCYMLDQLGSKGTLLLTF